MYYQKPHSVPSIQVVVKPARVGFFAHPVLQNLLAFSLILFSFCAISITLILQLKRTVLEKRRYPLAMLHMQATTKLFLPEMRFLLNWWSNFTDVYWVKVFFFFDRDFHISFRSIWLIGMWQFLQSVHIPQQETPLV